MYDKTGNQLKLKFGPTELSIQNVKNKQAKHLACALKQKIVTFLFCFGSFNPSKEYLIISVYGSVNLLKIKLVFVFNRFWLLIIPQVYTTMFNNQN